MRKPDEIALFGELKRRTAGGTWPHRTPGDEFVWVRALAKELGIPERRAEYLAEKWADRGWYEYGVHCLAGWLTDAGRAVEIDDRPTPTPKA